jgi:hypothetical protein
LTVDAPNPPSERATGQQECADSWTVDLDMNYGKSNQHSASGNSLWHVCIDDVCVIRGPRPAYHRQYLMVFFHSHSLVTSLSLSLARSLTPPPPPFYLVFVLGSLSLPHSFSLVHSLSPGSGSSFLSHSYLSGLTVSLALSLSGLSFLWVRFPHSVTQSFFTQSSLLNLSILISQVSVSLALAPRVPHSRSLNLELPELFVRLSSNSILLLLSLTSARARTLSLARSRALISLPRSHSLTYLAGALALAHPRTRAPFLSRARERSLELYFELYFELLSLTCSGSC